MADPFPPSRRTRMLRIALAVSLAINLAVVGLTLGMVLRGHDGRPPRDFDMSLGPVARALAPEDRAAIRDSLRSRRDLEPRRDRSADLDALIAALGATPYDPAALRAALEAPADRFARVQAVAAQALADRIDTMTAEERAALASRLQDGGKPGPGPDR